MTEPGENRGVRAVSRRALIAAATAAVTALAAAGCGGASSGGGTTPGVQKERTTAVAPQADVAKVSIDLGIQATSIDPLVDTYLADSRLVALTSGRLFDFKPGSATATVPALAQSGTASGGGRKFDVTLKAGLKFSDGSPLTADDVKATFARADETTPHVWVHDVKRVVVHSPTKLTFELSKPYGHFDQYFAVPAAGIVSRRAQGDRDFFRAPTVLSGPYTVQGNYRAKSFSLIRNDNYGGPRPAVARFDVNDVIDPVSAATQVRSGDLDVSLQIPRETATQFTGNAVAVANPDIVTEFLVPNQRKGTLFADARIRQALELAVDRRSLINVAYGPEARTQTGPVPPLGGLPDAAVGADTPDLAKARALLKGTKCESGCSFKASYFASTETTEGRVAVALQQQLKPLGMTVKPDAVEDQTFIARTTRGNYDLSVVVSGGFNVPDSINGGIDTGPAQCIFAGCENGEIGPAYDRLIAAQDPAETRAAVDAINTVFKSWAPVVPIGTEVLYYGIQARLQDVLRIQPNSTIWVAPAAS
jgi:peptide/nickel transport system substrate-binding protein